MVEKRLRPQTRKQGQRPSAAPTLTAAAAALCESAGGKLVGMFGVMGQDHHIMAICDMPSLPNYMSMYMKIMQSGAFEMLRTVNLYTGADVVAAAEMVDSTTYKAPNQ